jgi:large subunit ribosomal protein L6
MSRIGKLPVKVPAGVEVTIEGQIIKVKGSKGELSLEIVPVVKVELNEGEIVCTRINEQKKTRALHGLTRSLINNLIIGVSEGFEKKLEIHGVGYRAEGGGNQLTLHLGFSHPVIMKAPEGVTVEIDKDQKNLLVIKGYEKQKVGQFAAEIRSLRKPEPYKGKGIHYLGEKIVRKAGKKAAAGSK